MKTEDRDEKGRFVEGNPGGPGRPRFSIVAIMREKLQSVPPGEKRAFVERWIDRYFDDAYEKNDGIALRDAVDRFDGKPKQTVHVENEKDAEWLEYLKGLDKQGDADDTG